MAGESFSSSSLAGRYATALNDLALESKSVDTVAGELKRLKDLLLVRSDPSALVRALLTHRPPPSALRWIKD